MINLPEKFNSLKFLRPISWAEIFDDWRRGEAGQDSWKAHWEERGYSSWDEWRKKYAAPLRPEKLEWFLYEITEPLKITPEISGVPSHGWIAKAYSGEKTKKLKEILDLPIVKDNEKVKEVKNNFPKETMLTAIVSGGEIVLVEGMHRSCALASWDNRQEFRSQVFIALARWNEKEIPAVGSGYKSE